MGRRRLAATGMIGVVLIVCAYGWPPEPNPPASLASRTVRVVPGTERRSNPLVPLRLKKVAPGSPEQASIAESATSSIADDPQLVASFPDPALQPRPLYRRVRAEVRDRDWAARSERSIRAALTAVPYLDHGNVRVDCASTLCEVRGTMTERLSDDNANVAMQALQGQQLQEPLERAGLESAVATFGGENGARSFTIYMQRR